MYTHMKKLWIILIVSSTTVSLAIGHSSSMTHNHAHPHENQSHESSWLLSLCASFVVSLLSFSGAMLLYKNMGTKMSLLFTSLAIGSLLGETFFHLFPTIYHHEAHGAHSHDVTNHSENHEHDNNLEYEVYSSVIILGYMVCFVTEMIIRYRQHMNDVYETLAANMQSNQQSSKKAAHYSHSDLHGKIKAFGWLNLFSDGIHNFMDGMGLAGAFNISASLGFATTLCICLHELPQEMSDFAVLLNAGFSVKRALIFNFFSGVVAVIGCFVGLILNQQAHSIPSSTSNNWLLLLLNERALVSITAGSFLYIIACMCQELGAQIFEEKVFISSIVDHSKANSKTVSTENKAQKKTDKKSKNEEKSDANNISTSKTTIHSSMMTALVGISTGIVAMYTMHLFEHQIHAYVAA
jgi:zinc transporter ZupT